MGEVTEKIYCCDRDDNNNALAAAIYLGALGEWQTVYNNKTKVNSAMSLIGGTPFNTSSSYWSSTQYGNRYSWMFNWTYGLVDHSKYSMSCVRAFCPLSNNQNT